MHENNEESSELIANTMPVKVMSNIQRRVTG